MPNRYIRATLMYSASVLSLSFTKETSVSASSKKELSGSHRSISIFAG